MVKGLGFRDNDIGLRVQARRHVHLLSFGS